MGIGVAYAGTKLIVSLAFRIGGPNNYIPIEATPSSPVLLFTLAVSLLTGVLFGIAPAWMTSQTDPAEALRGAGRAVGAGRSWLQKSLVIAQVAVSLVLLSAAALLGQSLRNLEHQNFGFETQGRYIAWINPMLGNYKPERMEPMFREIDDNLLAIPGVRLVAPALHAPMTGDSWNEGIRIEGRPEPPATEDTGASWARVMPGFFETIGAKVVLGRPITDQDAAATRKVAVINQAFARRFFKDQNPIGQHFGIDKVKYSATFEIVGVTNDVRYLTYEYKKPVRPMFWVPEAQTVQTSVSYPVQLLTPPRPRRDPGYRFLLPSRQRSHAAGVGRPSHARRRSHPPLLERRTQAQDHPLLLTVPETHYLKCLILEVL